MAVFLVCEINTVPIVFKVENIPLLLPSKYKRYLSYDYRMHDHKYTPPNNNRRERFYAHIS